MKRSIVKYVAVAAASLAVCVLVAAALIWWKWPWREATVRKVLEKSTGGQVVIGSFHATYFPPGCVMDNITVSNPEAKGYPPLYTASGITVSTSYGIMLSGVKRITVLGISGMHVTIPPRGVPQALHPKSGSPGDFVIERVNVKHGIVEFLSNIPGAAATVVEIHHLVLENATKNQPMAFDAALQSPSPPGEIRATGHIGPWQSGGLASTPVSGAYLLEHADLAGLKGVSGFVKAEGKFSGELGAIGVLGSATVPDFQVVPSNHPVPVSSNYSVVASILTGDVSIRKIQARWGQSTLDATGKLTDLPGRPGKTLLLNTEISHGRVEDLLLFFTRRPEPSMYGSLRFKAQIVVPPKPPKLLQRLRATGDFQIEGSRFSNTRVQNLLNKLDRSAAGIKKSKATAPLVLSELSGHINARAGTATLSNVLVGSPGSRVLAEGTFNLVDKTVNLNGLLQTEGKLSDTTSGFKSFMLKAMTPLWLHRNSVSDVAFRITGKPSHLHFALRMKRTSHL